MEYERIPPLDAAVPAQRAQPFPPFACFYCQFTLLIR